jgi:hypothetical protein
MNRIALLAKVGLVLASCAGQGFAQEKELGDIARSLMSQLRLRGKSPVAITSFSGGVYCPAFSTYIADRLGIFLVKSNTDFDVVTRERVEEVFKEINLQLGQNYDASTFARIGKQIGARSIIRGHYTVQPAAATIGLAVQVIDVETGLIIGGEIGDLRYTGDIKNMLDAPGCSVDQPSPTVADSTSSIPAPNHPTYETKRFRQLQVAFRGCRIVAAGLLCEVLVTNFGSPQKYCIYSKDHDAKSRALDASGAIYTVSNISFGDDSSRWNACASLPTGVPIRGSLLFPDLGLEQGRLALLEFVFDFPPHPAIPMPAGSRSPESWVTFEFRGVTIEK